MGRQWNREALATLERRLLITVLISLISVVAGCKKSVEDLEKGWTSNLKAADGLAANYPAFKTAIQERKAAAASLYDSAQGLEEEAKKAKLADASALLLKGFIGQLKHLDKNTAALRSALTSAATNSGDLAYLEAAKMMSSQANRTLDGIDAKLKTGAKTAVEADAILASITKDLKSLKKQVAKLAKKAKEAKTASDKATKSKAAAAQKKADENKPWRCEYCSSSNVATANKCENCGASRPATK